MVGEPYAESRRVDRVDAGRPAREVEAERLAVAVARDLGDDLPEPERDDREVVATQPQRRQADEDSAHGRDDRGGEQNDPDRDVDSTEPGGHTDAADIDVDRLPAENELRCVRRGEPGRRVGAERVERDVAEVEETGVADDHVQAHGHHREDGHHRHRVDAREAVEDRHLEQEPLVVRLLDEERVRDREARGWSPGGAQRRHARGMT